MWPQASKKVMMGGFCKYHVLPRVFFPKDSPLCAAQPRGYHVLSRFGIKLITITEAEGLLKSHVGRINVLPRALFQSALPCVLRNPGDTMFYPDLGLNS